MARVDTSTGKPRVAQAVSSASLARSAIAAFSTAASNLPSSTSSQARTVATDASRNGEVGVLDASTQSTISAASARRAVWTHSNAISAAASTTSGSSASNSWVSRSTPMPA